MMENRLISVSPSWRRLQQNDKVMWWWKIDPIVWALHEEDNKRKKEYWDIRPKSKRRVARPDGNRFLQQREGGRFRRDLAPFCLLASPLFFSVLAPSFVGWAASLFVGWLGSLGSTAGCSSRCASSDAGWRVLGDLRPSAVVVLTSEDLVPLVEVWNESIKG